MNLEIIRICAVMALLVIASIISTPKNKIPLALAGIRRILKQQLGNSEKPEPVAAYKRLIAFLLVIAAAVIAVI